MTMTNTHRWQVNSAMTWKISLSVAFRDTTQDGDEHTVNGVKAWSNESMNVDRRVRRVRSR